jgi:hypothetical protein
MVSPVFNQKGWFSDKQGLLQMWVQNGKITTNQLC